MFVINSLAGGGAERVMSTLLAYSEPEAREFDLSLALLDREPAAYAAPPWLTVHQLDAKGSLAASVAGLCRVFRRERPDVALSFLTRANIANVAASRTLGRPAVISERVNTASHLGGGLRGLASRLAVRLAYPLAAKVVAVSPGVADELRASFGVAADRLVTIDNPVDVAALRAKAQEPPELALAEPYVLGMGRLTPNKNFRLLVEAFHRAGTPGKLVILGEGPERDNLVRLGEKLGLGGRLVMPGFLRNPFPVVARARIFVLPSNAEGFPNGLVEAMALGAPVISTNCRSGPSEILAGLSRNSVDGLLRAEHGLLVPTDAVELMAQALKLLDDEGLRRRYAERAASRAEQFGVETTKARYWSLLRAEAART